MRLCALVLLTASCQTESIVHDIDEKQANNIIVLLDDHKIPATKQRVEGRNVSYTVAVRSSAHVGALRVLRTHEYPKDERSGWTRLTDEEKLIPSRVQEKAAMTEALEGEIERQLSLMAGILDVEVNVSVPESSDLVTGVQPDSKASVVVKYLGNQQPDALRIKGAVAAGVDGLDPARVVVIMSPGEIVEHPTECTECPPVTGPFAGLTTQQQYGLAVTAAVMLMLLALGVIFGQLRLRSVRGRFVRLQEEISKARRKPVAETS